MGASSSVGHRPNGLLGLDHAGGVVGRAQERDRRLVLGEDAADRVHVEGEVVGPLPRDAGRARDLRDVGVQGVGGLERGRHATRPAVGEAQGLEDLVGAVGHEHLRRRHPVLRADRLPQRLRGPVGVAVPLDPVELLAQRLPEPGRWRLGRLVGVEPDLDIDLRRVVAGVKGEVVAHRRAPHHRTTSFWGTSVTVWCAMCPPERERGVIGRPAGGPTGRGRRGPRPRPWPRRGAPAP